MARDPIPLRLPVQEEWRIALRNPAAPGMLCETGGAETEARTEALLPARCSNGAIKEKAPLGKTQ